MDISNVYRQLISYDKDTAWVPGHVGILENTVVDLAAKSALEGTVSKRLAVTYSVLKC